MVKLSAKYLIRRNKSNKYFLNRKKTDTDEEFLKRITHLPVQNQFIEQILKIDNCINVKVLYLQNNLLTSLENIDNFPNLTHLYLQRNFLKKIDNLNSLIKLKKIYLGHNEIQVLEGMEHFKEIKEVHLENQDLAAGESMYFEPMTIQNLGETLEVLNISNNYLTSIRGLENLKSLKFFNASNNYIMELEDVTTVISGWSNLKELNLTGNEVTKCKRYKDSMICAAKNLDILDNSPIHPNTRIYVEKLAEQKKLFEARKKNNNHDAESTAKTGNVKTLKFVQDAESKETFFTDVIDPFPPKKPIFFHLPWNLRVNVNATNSERGLPRPYWKKGGFKSFQES